MHQFIVKSVRGQISPVGDSKQKLWEKLLKKYEDENKSFKITVEGISKNISESQEGLYKAFIVKASEHFGNTYEEMEELLIRFHPMAVYDIGRKTRIPVSRWKNNHLDLFINQATPFLAEYGFNF